MAGDSARLSSSALVALEGNDCTEGFNVATRLKRSKALRANLEVWEASRLSALQLFNDLVAVLCKAAIRIETNLDRCSTMVKALTGFKPTVRQYGQRTVPKGNDIMDAVENIAIATEQKARRSLLETNDAAESSREIIGRLQSLGPVLAARQRKVTDTIHAQREEARKFKQDTEKELRESEMRTDQLRQALATLSEVTDD
jgi:hypothetical protein